MTISGISGGSSMFQMGGSNPMAKMKQNFDDLGKALQSGNLDDAKKAFDQLQKNAPPQGGNSKNPVSSDFDSLGKALDSGDLKGAKDAYAKIQEKISQGPPAVAHAGGRPPQGAQGAAGQSKTSGSKSYDKKDANQDGTVTSLEELEYDLKHPTDSKSASEADSDNTQGKSGIHTYV